MKSLIQACRSGDLRNVKEVMCRYPSLINNDTVRIGWGLLHQAVDLGHFEIVNYLIPLFLNLNDAKKYAARLSFGIGRVEIARLLYSLGVDIFIRDGLEVSWAAERGWVGPLKCLIELRPIDLIYIEHGFKWAKNNGCTQVVEYLNNLVIGEMRKYTMLLILNKNRCINIDLIPRLIKFYIKYSESYRFFQEHIK